MGWEQGLHSALVPAVEQGQMGLGDLCCLTAFFLAGEVW